MPPAATSEIDLTPRAIVFLPIASLICCPAHARNDVDREYATRTAGRLRSPVGPILGHPLVLLPVAARWCFTAMSIREPPNLILANNVGRIYPVEGPGRPRRYTWTIGAPLCHVSHGRQKHQHDE